MIAISKKERDVISERYPDVHIVRTMKQKSKRHRYYCEETRQVMRLLNTMRNNGVEQKEGGKHTDKPKRKRIAV